MAPKEPFGDRVARVAGTRLKFILPAAVVLVAGIALAWWYYAGRESTDDAQIDGHIAQVSSSVGGRVIGVHVHDNQPVKKGTVLVEIDARDYQAAVDRAAAELASARASAEAARLGVPITRTETTSGVATAQGGLEQARAGIATAEHEIAAARARLASAEATLRQREAEAARAGRDAERLKALIAKEEIPQQQYDAAVSAADAARAAAEAARAVVAEAQTAIGVANARAEQARAGSEQAQASLRNAQTAPQQVAATRAQASVAEARVKQAEAVLAQAQLNLDHATVRAMSAGIVSRKTVEVGQTIAPGQPLMALVDLDDLWVTANLKETQLRDIQPGQRARISVDALGGREFTGKVDSVAAATGARFSLLPPDNATGNYVKVVQRVPVKIVFDPGQDPEHRLRPGMSVVPTILLRN
jgi:membrane fusion protein (multidrug efflux system)